MGNHMVFEYKERWTWRNLLSLGDTMAYLRHRWYWYKQDRQNKL